MNKKKLDNQIEALKVQAKQLEVAEVEFLERQKKEEEEKRLAEEKALAEAKPYKVFGRDIFVKDRDIVEFYKNRMKVMEVQYRLVGKVNDEGEYVISDEIKYDLVAMKKAIEEMGDDYYKASALYMKKYFNFTIKLTMLDDGRARAVLCIAEYVGKYADDETIYTFVAEFVDVYDADFRVKLRKAFNLFDVEVKNDDFNVPSLAVLMQDLYDIDQYVGGLYDLSSQIYVIRMLKVLESGGEVEQEILERYKQLVSQLEEEESLDDPFKPKRDRENSKLKELLDKAIDEKGGLESLDVDKEQLKKVVGEVNQTEEAIGNIKIGGMLEIDLPNKKEGGSGGGGSSAKKKSKKKSSSKDSKGKDKKNKKKDKKADKKKGDGVTYDNSNSKSFDELMTVIKGMGYDDSDDERDDEEDFVDEELNLDESNEEETADEVEEIEDYAEVNTEDDEEEEEEEDEEELEDDASVVTEDIIDDLEESSAETEDAIESAEVDVNENAEYEFE